MNSSSVGSAFSCKTSFFASSQNSATSKRASEGGGKATFSILFDTLGEFFGIRADLARCAGFSLVEVGPPRRLNRYD
jgi:hypothetical protein